MSWKDMAEEVAQHLRDQYAELRAAGYSHQDAMKTTASEIADVNPNDWPRRGVIGGLWQDLRFGARLLVKDRGASTVVVVTLALAIAANGIVFGLADLLLLRPLPFGNAHRLVAVFGVDHQQGHDRQRLSLPDYRDVVEQSTVFEDVAAFRRGQQLSLTGAGDPIAVSAAMVTANVFRTWGVPAVAGRTILPDEGAPGRNAVAALAHRFWKSHFAGDPSIVGRAILLNGRSYTVVGVIAPEIELGNLSETDLWVPFEASGAERRDERASTVFGLLKPGATLANANSELATIGERLARAYPATNGTWGLFAITLRESIAGSTTWIILALLGLVVGLVLVVACANVATVMLARASARRREIAVRVALGATRGRLVRQLVSEGLLIGVASGVVGLLVTYLGLTAFRTLSPEVFFQRLSINANLLTFAFALSIATPILFGVMPALQSSRPNLNEDLKEGGRESSFSVRGNRSRSVLVVAQVGFALAVLIVSGLIVRTVIGLERVPLGMNPDGVLTTRVRFDPPNYADEGARLRAIESILARLSSLPGVTAATAVRSLPIAEAEPRRQFTIAGRAAPPAGSAPWAMEAATLGEYGRAIGCAAPRRARLDPVGPRGVVVGGARQSRGGPPLLARPIARRRSHHDDRRDGPAGWRRHRNHRRRGQRHRTGGVRAAASAHLSAARHGAVAGERRVCRPHRRRSGRAGFRDSRGLARRGQEPRGERAAARESCARRVDADVPSDHVALHRLCRHRARRGGGRRVRRHRLFGRPTAPRDRRTSRAGRDRAPM